MVFRYTSKIAGDDSDEQNLDSKRPLKYFAVDSVGDVVGKEVQDDLYVYGNGPSAYYSVEYDDKKKAKQDILEQKYFSTNPRCGGKQKTHQLNFIQMYKNLLGLPVMKWKSILRRGG